MAARYSDAMARKLRVEYPGAAYPALNRGCRREESVARGAIPDGAGNALGALIALATRRRKKNGGCLVPFSKRRQNGSGEAIKSGVVSMFRTYPFPVFGCARLATLAFTPPHPGGVRTNGRKTICRNSFTPASK